MAAPIIPSSAFLFPDAFASDKAHARAFMYTYITVLSIFILRRVKIAISDLARRRRPVSTSEPRTRRSGQSKRPRRAHDRFYFREKLDRAVAHTTTQDKPPDDELQLPSAQTVSDPSSMPRSMNPIGQRSMYLTLKASFCKYLLYTPPIPQSFIRFLPVILVPDRSYSDSASKAAGPAKDEQGLSIQRRLNTSESCCRKSYLSFTLAHLVLFLFYALSLFLCILLGKLGSTESALRNNPNRAGFLALIQLPLVFLLSSKNPLIHSLLSASAERLNWFHRMVGRFITLSVLVHGALWTERYRRKGQFDNLKPGTQSFSGWLAFAFLLLLVLSSLKAVRRLAYHVFYAVHLMCIAGFFVALCYHTSHAAPYIYPCLAILAFDLVLRLLRVRFVMMTLRAHQGGTEVTVHHLNCGYLPSQYVFLRVFLPSLGLFTTFGAHPITIISERATEGKANGFTLFIKSSGNWSRGIHKSLVNQRGPSVRKALGLIDGPYGEDCAHLKSYRHLLFIAGGSGVTWTLGVVHGLLSCPSDEPLPRRIKWIWVTRDYDSIHWQLRVLEDVTKMTSKLGVSFSAVLYITEGLPPAEKEEWSKLQSTSLRLVAGRPDLESVIEEHVQGFVDGTAQALDVEKAKASAPGETIRSSQVGSDERQGMAILTSGPESFTSEVRNISIGIDLGRQRALGGVDCYVESLYR